MDIKVVLINHHSFQQKQRRMRRSTSMLEVDRSHERYDLPMSHIPVKPERGIKLHIPVTKSTSFTSHLPPTSNPTFPIVPPEAPPRRSKKKKPTKYIHRSLSALGISSDRKGGQEESVMYNPYACYYGAEPGKRWNTSGFLNSTGSLNIHSDEASSSSDQEQDDRETVSVKDSDSSSNASSDNGPVLAIDVVNGEKEQKRADRHRRHHRHHHHHHVHKDKNPYVINIEDGSGPIPVVVEENYYRIEAMLQAMSEEEEMNSKRSGSSLTSKKSFKQLGGKIIDIVNIPKRIKQNSKEKKRFNVYTIPLETREQLKQIYVY